MLTPRLPETISQLLTAIPLGLLALFSVSDRRRILVVKIAKEAILAVKLRKEFKVYVVSFRSGRQSTIGLVTAFFDDADEPLTICTPLFEDGQCEDLRETLLEPEVEVHFFDEHCRELLGYRATVSMPHQTRSVLRAAKLYPCTANLLRAMLDGLPEFFWSRIDEDDAAAITVSFGESTVPEDLFIMETRPDRNAFHGSPAVRHTTLIRPEPGQQQEWDVIDLLQRTFDPRTIFHGPLKVTDGEEIADVVIVTNKHILAVQAKDSPNTEAIANNKLSRKRATAIKNLAKALAQVRGAVRYIGSSPQLAMRCGDEDITLSVEGKKLFSLVVSKELFIDQYDDYSPMIFKTWTDTGVPCVALDYMELTQFMSHVVGEEPFFEVIERIHTVAQERGLYPRSRFGLGPQPPKIA